MVTGRSTRLETSRLIPPAWCRCRRLRPSRQRLLTCGAADNHRRRAVFIDTTHVRRFIGGKQEAPSYFEYPVG